MIPYLKSVDYNGITAGTYVIGGLLATALMDVPIDAIAVQTMMSANNLFDLLISPLYMATFSYAWFMWKGALNLFLPFILLYFREFFSN